MDEMRLFVQTWHYVESEPDGGGQVAVRVLRRLTTPVAPVAGRATGEILDSVEWRMSAPVGMHVDGESVRKEFVVPRDQLKLSMAEGVKKTWRGWRFVSTVEGDILQALEKNGVMTEDELLRVSGGTRADLDHLEEIELIVFLEGMANAVPDDGSTSYSDPREWALFPQDEDS